MQQSSNPSRRPRRWLRLTALIAGIGALAVVGAALGRGLDTFDTGDAEAHAPLATPVAVAAGAPALASSPTSAPTFTATSAPLSPATTGEQGQGVERQPSIFPSPPTPSPTPGRGEAGISPSPHVGEVAGGEGADTAPGRQPPARLPETSGDEVVLGLSALGIALYLAGVALFLAPQIFTGTYEEKERRNP
jgi:hypothetical protein